jgi:hypothetical protein
VRTIGDQDVALDTYLTGFATDRQAVLDQVIETFPDPLHVVASGSVAAGYAIPGSDLDVYALLDGQGGTIPLVSHELGTLMDIYGWGSDATIAACEALAAGPLMAGVSAEPAARWEQTRGSLANAIRLAIGVVLDTSPAWVAHRDWLRSGWLAGRAAEYWQLNAWRYAATARALAGPRPLDALVTAADAALSALKMQVTRRGLTYFHTKWLPVEVRALEDAELIATHRQLVRAAADVGDPAAGTGALLALVDRFAGPPTADIVVDLSYRPGVELRRVPGRALLHRWELHGLCVTGDVPDPEVEGPFWSGPPAEPLPAWAQELAANDMAWIGVRRDVG